MGVFLERVVCLDQMPDLGSKRGACSVDTAETTKKLRASVLTDAQGKLSVRDNVELAYVHEPEQEFIRVVRKGVTEFNIPITATQYFQVAKDQDRASTAGYGVAVGQAPLTKAEVVALKAKQQKAAEDAARAAALAAEEAAKAPPKP